MSRVQGRGMRPTSRPRISTGPAVHWAPQKISESITRGQTREVSVVLGAAETLSDVVLRVVPKLALFVDVSPSTLAFVPAGTTVAIRLTIRAGASAVPGSYDGVVQVRQRSRRGAPVLARPLPIVIIVLGEEPLAGVDGDGNGVWDYVDAFINNAYRGASLADRAAMRQFSRALQGGLMNAANQDASLLYAESSDRATECLLSLRPSDAGRVIQDVKAAILNNQSRSRAFLMWSDQSVGQVFRARPRAQRSASCIPE